MERMPTPDEVRQRAEAILERAEAAGGDRGALTLVAVTKAFPVEYVKVALAAGLVDMGENYAQELVSKAEALAVGDAGVRDGPRCRWHFIGGLQRNKVKLLARTVHLWHSVDRASLVDEIARRAPGDRILIQVNTTGEEQKSGCTMAEAPALVERGRERGLVVEGLMTVGPTADVDPRPCFARLRQLGQTCGTTELSMGMSADFELAVAEGATMIRIGSALFGARPPRP
jgi:pyridoxal phosphate enzyme (YggS family)